MRSSNSASSVGNSIGMPAVAALFWTASTKGRSLASFLKRGSVTVAFTQAHAAFGRTQDPGEANSTFLALIGRGTAGVEAALTDTAYA